jgi:hypothetical protein
MCHEGSSTLRSDLYQGTAAQNKVPQATWHQWFEKICCCWKLFSSIIVCILCFKHIEQKQREGGQQQTADFNSEVTELCWNFCSQINICWPPSVMITLSLWVTESIIWVSTAKLCRSHSDHMWPHYTHNNQSQNWWRILTGKVDMWNAEECNVIC